MSWGGPGYDKCAQLMNADFMSIFYKTTFGMGVKLLGSYMVSACSQHACNGPLVSARMC